MKVNQLKQLVNRTPGMQGVSKKSKAEIIADPKKRLPELNAPTKRKLDESGLASLKTEKDELLPPTSNDHELLDFYNDHYGWLDQIDKDFYKICKTTYNHTWEKCFGAAMIVSFICSTWAIHEECQFLKHQTRLGGDTDKRMKKTWNILILFITIICKQIGSL